MSAKFFLDTNIVVYTFDSSAPKKKRRAQELIEQALRSQEGVVSTQVVQEFLNVATTKFSVPLTLSDAQQYLHDVLGPLCSVFPSIDLYRQALILQPITKSKGAYPRRPLRLLPLEHAPSTTRKMDSRSGPPRPICG